MDQIRIPLPGVAVNCAPPSPPERHLARIKSIHRVEFAVRQDAGRRNPADPAPSSLPGANRGGIVHCDRPVILDNPPAAFRDLPFQGVTRQTLGCIALPYIAPEVFLSLGTFSCLNALSHAFKLIPCSGRMLVPVFPKQVSSILQNTYVSEIRDSYNLPIYRVGGHQFRIQCGDFGCQVRAQINQVLF